MVSTLTEYVIQQRSSINKGKMMRGSSYEIIYRTASLARKEKNEKTEETT